MKKHHPPPTITRSPKQAPPSDSYTAHTVAQTRCGPAARHPGGMSRAALQGGRARAAKAQPSAALRLAAELNGSTAKLNNAAVLLGVLSASTSEVCVLLLLPAGAFRATRLMRYTCAGGAESRRRGVGRVLLPLSARQAVPASAACGTSRRDTRREAGRLVRSPCAAQLRCSSQQLTQDAPPSARCAASGCVACMPPSSSSWWRCCAAQTCHVRPQLPRQRALPAACELMLRGRNACATQVPSNCPRWRRSCGCVTGAARAMAPAAGV
jgi:hypothetical protein